jgi:ubiquinone/menaquinone biosynthesis C-methylase UbiE
VTIASHDAEVTSRFDASVARFKADVPPDDYRLEAVSRAISGLECPLVLDLGCGKGRFARELTRRGAKVIGLDLSSRMLSSAAGLPRVRATARALPFVDACFDAVIAIEILEHVGDPAGVIAEARRVLRPGGRLVVIDKNACSLNAARPWLPNLFVKWIDERRGLWMYPAGGAVRERWFGPRRLAQMLERQFDRVSVQFLLSPPESLKKVFRAIPAVRLMACWTGVAQGGGN